MTEVYLGWATIAWSYRSKENKKNFRGKTQGIGKKRRWSLETSLSVHTQNWKNVEEAQLKQQILCFDNCKSQESQSPQAGKGKMGRWGGKNMMSKSGSSEQTF